MITNHKINKSEELELLQKITISISKKLKNPISFYYRENFFKVNVNLNKNIKELVPEKIYNSILLSATIHNNKFCTSLINSTGEQIVEKLAHSLYFLQASFAKPPVNQTIGYKNNNDCEFSWELENYLGIESDQRKMVKNLLIEIGIIKR